MVTLSSAQNALKSVYLNVLAEQLNINSNALMSKIKQTNKDVYGKEIIKLAPFGLNGGICASSETGELPESAGHKFLQFKTDLKNLYGTIALSDKAIRASMSDTGAFVNLLNDEMESLIKSSCFNLGRMVYGDGTGLLATVTVTTSNTNTTTTFSSVKNFVEGMRVDIHSGSTVKTTTVTYVDRRNKTVSFADSITFANGDKIYASGSKDNEITGIKRIFDTTDANKMLYGVDRSAYKWLYPYVDENSSEASMSDVLIQKALNYIEEETGSQVDFIAMAGDVRNLYQNYLASNRRNIDVATLAGGYKAMTYAGIPVVFERFVDDGTMYLLNTKDFNIHQLCDWEWLEGENGNILIPSAKTPTYSATLVKYAELICDRPSAQGKVCNIVK